MFINHSIFSLVFVFICWRIVNTQKATDDNRIGTNKNLAVERMMRYTPDMRLVLNGLLRYDNAISRKADDSLPYPFLHLTSRSSSKAVAPPVDDPLAVLATGFLGSRGKRDDYDEIPVFANGFPAGRG